MTPLKSKILILLGFRHLFRWLTPLKFENFDQKSKISTTTQKNSRCSYWETIIITSLHHTFRIENFKFLGISSLISCANTFKIGEFRPKIENFHHHLNFFKMFILRNK